MESFSDSEGNRIPLRVRHASSPGGWADTSTAGLNGNLGAPGIEPAETPPKPLTKLEQLHADIAEYERFEAAVRAERRAKGKAAKKARRKNRGRA